MGEVDFTLLVAIKEGEKLLQLAARYFVVEFDEQGVYKTLKLVSVQQSLSGIPIFGSLQSPLNKLVELYLRGEVVLQKPPCLISVLVDRFNHIRGHILIVDKLKVLLDIFELVPLHIVSIPLRLQEVLALGALVIVSILIDGLRVEFKGSNIVQEVWVVETVAVGVLLVKVFDVLVTENRGVQSEAIQHLIEDVVVDMADFVLVLRGQKASWR